MPGLRRAAWVRAGYLPAVNRQVTGSILIAGACESCFCPAGMRGSLLGAGEACGAHPNPRRRPAAPAERRARVAAPPVLKEVGGIHPPILPSLHRLAPLPVSDDSSPSQPGSSGNGALATGWPVLARARRTSRLARHAVAEVDDSRAEGAGPGEFEIHPALALGKNGMPPPTSNDELGALAGTVYQTLQEAGAVRAGSNAG